MTRTVEDGARIFNVVAGYDSADPLTVPDMREENYLDFLNIDGLSGKRIGILRVLVDQKNADEEIKSIFAQAILDMESAGAVMIILKLLDSRNYKMKLNLVEVFVMT